MKVILSGVTGFIGSEVIRQCIEHPSITQIVALSRSQLSKEQTGSPKVKSILVEDFTSYSSDVGDEMRDADACIWALGKAWVPDDDVAKTIHIDYPLAAARAIVEQRQTADPVRFILLSGGATERDQSKSLWFAGPYRKIRGQAENEILAYGKEHSADLRVFVMRPGMVLKKEFNMRDAVRGLAPSARVDVLARAMIEVAVKGGEKETFENVDLESI